MITDNNISISFPQEIYCADILYKFASNDRQNNNNVYFNNLTSQNYFVNIQNKKYSKLYSFLIKCIEISTKTLHNQNSFFILKLFSNYNSQWKLCVFNNIMFNCPFTLSDVIFIPLNYLSTSYKNNNYNIFSNTLVHEKIHIIQRLNLNKWINIINLSFKKWVLIKNNTPIYNYLINYNFKKKDMTRILNPDVTYDFLYLYTINDKYYYGFFNADNSNNITIVWFQLNNINNNLNLIQSFDSNLPKEEHPFEMFAYKFADFLL